jgi:hypothetical protein
MAGRLDNFFAGSTKHLRLGALGCAVAAVGAVIAVSIDYGPGNPLSFVAVGFVFSGILITGMAVARGWYDALKRGGWWWGWRE